MTDQLVYRAFAGDLEIRSAAQGGDGRTIHGIAVPYGQPIRIDAHLVEQFARGAFNHQMRAANRVFLARDHAALGGSIMGRLGYMRDDAAGLYVEGRVSRTPIGEETLELVRDGVLDQLSIGFVEDKDRRLGDGTIERTRAHLREVAVVPVGAYRELASIGGVRSAEGDQVTEALSRLDQARRILAGLPVLKL